MPFEVAEPREVDPPLAVVGLCADEALEVGLDKDFERGRLLLDGAREEVEALQQRVG